MRRNRLGLTDKAAVEPVSWKVVSPMLMPKEVIQETPGKVYNNTISQESFTFLSAKYYKGEIA